MKIEFASSIVLIFASFLFATCRKANMPDKSSQINIPKLQECYHSQPHDSATISNKLIGSWNWQQQSCFISNSKAGPDQIVNATFNELGFFVVTENANVTALGTWRIKSVGNNYFGVDSTELELDISQPSGFLRGVIYICDNQLLISESYADGCNTLFMKE